MIKISEFGSYSKGLLMDKQTPRTMHSHEHHIPATVIQPHDHHGLYDADHAHDHTLLEELACHFPYAVFAVAIGLAILSILSFLSADMVMHDPAAYKKGAKLMFHSFHFMHIAFAATGTLLTYLRYSSQRMTAIIVGIVAPSIFCTLSDAILPYLGGLALGVPMKFHLCFFHELKNVIPFLSIGIINGFILGAYNRRNNTIYSFFSHSAHIIVSSLASIFYLVSHGFTNWHSQIGMVFLFLIIAVVLPCTISDVIIPMVIARAGKKHEKHTA